MPNKRKLELMVGAAHAVLIGTLVFPALAESEGATEDAGSSMQSPSQEQPPQMQAGPAAGGYRAGGGWPGGAYGMGGGGQGMGPGGYGMGPAGQGMGPGGYGMGPGAYGMGPGYGMDVPPPPPGYGSGDVPPPPPGYQGGVEPPAPGLGYPGSGYGPGGAAAAPAPPRTQASGPPGMPSGQRAPGMRRHHLGMGGRGMMPRGMAGGHRRMGGRGMMGPQWALDLTNEQREQLENIAADVQKTHWDLMGQRMEQAMKLRRLYAAERPDAKAIGEVYGKMFDLKRQMIEASIEGRNRAQDVLTDEQRAQLKATPRRPGPPPGWE